MTLLPRYRRERFTAGLGGGGNSGKGGKDLNSRNFSLRDFIVKLRDIIFWHIRFFFHFSMPRSLFDTSMEKELLRLYVEVFAGSSGKTLTSAEKHTSIAEKLNSQGVVLGWPTVTASNVDNKIDAVRRKGKKVYKTFRLKTRTGAPVEEDFDLKVGN